MGCSSPFPQDLLLLGKKKIEEKKQAVSNWKSKLAEFFVMPTEETNRALTEKGMNEIKDRVAGDVFLRRPEVGWSSLCALGFEGSDAPEDVQEQVEIQVK